MEALRLLSRSTGIRPQPAKSKDQTVPSDGGSFHSKKGLEPSKKRKRDEDASEENADRKMSYDEIRQIQKDYKIRIVNLQKINFERQQGSEKSRKRSKEDARLFPQPLTEFSQLRSRYSCNRSITSNIAEQGYYEPTAVQIGSLPLLLNDFDEAPNLLTVAPTGSGKTLAYLLPTIEKIRRQHVQDRVEGKESRHARSIILAPTKELVGQIVNEGRKLCKETGVSIAAMRKGMRLVEGQKGDESDQSSEEEEDSAQPARSQDLVKSDILVSTPLSLAHALVGADETTSPLPLVEAFILDEADVLLDPIFRDQTLSVWAALTSPNLHVSLWSATVGSNIEELSTSTIIQRKRELQILDSRPIVRVIVGLKDSSLPSINHKLIYAATEPGKLLGLRQLLHPSRKSVPSGKSSSTEPPALRPPFLIFTQTIERATSLFQELRYDIPAAAGGPSRIAVLHSSLSTTARSSIMTKFRKGEIWVLITTDLLSRGVDFKGINGVVNYDIPTTSAAYVHRAGRTGRAGRAGGICVTFYTREDIKYLKAIVSVIQASQKINSSTSDAPNLDLGLEKWILDALPELSRKDRRELKERGVTTRRALKDSDTPHERKMKRKAKISTKSGYERKLEDRRKGATEGSQRRKRQEVGQASRESDDEWDGFD